MKRRRLFRWGAALILVILMGVAAQMAAAQSDSLAISPPDGAAMSSTNYNLPWDVVANGGGVAASASFQLHSTIAQPGIGSLSSSNFRLHAGFWQALAFENLYLPLIER